MATLVPNNPYDVTQQKFTGFGDVSGQITGGARNGQNWDFMDQQGKVLTSVPYQDFVNNYQSDGSGAVRSGVTAVNGVPVFNFGNPGLAAPAAAPAAAPVSAAAPMAPATQAAPAATAAAAPASGIVGGVINNVASGNNAAASDIAKYNPMSNLSIQSYTPQTREVNAATETAAGQVESLLSKDSPLLQRARTIAMQNMAQRGLVNSSMAQGAGTAAMIDRITPIAQQDAQIYSNRALANMDAANTANQFNVGQNNQLYSQGLTIGANMAQQKDQQRFTTGEREATQQFQTSERIGAQAFQMDLQKAQQDFTAAQNNLQRAFENAQQDKSIKAQMDLQTAQQAFQGAQAQLDRAQQLAVAQKQIDAQAAQQAAQQAFAATQAQLDRENQAKMVELQDKLNQASVSKSFAASTALNTSNAINQVLVDPNIKPEDKKGAIDNIMNRADVTLKWGSTFYNTNMPTISDLAKSTTTSKPAWQVYLDANPDVTRVLGYSEEAAKSHYRRYGAAEGRQGAEELRKTL